MAGFTKGPFAYRPNEFDDWGEVRGPNGYIVALGRSINRNEDLDAHRRAGTDPYEEVGQFITAALNAKVALESLGYDGQAAIEELPALVALLEPFAEFRRVQRRIGGTYPKAGDWTAVESFEAGRAALTVEQLEAVASALTRIRKGGE